MQNAYCQTKLDIYFTQTDLYWDERGVCMPMQLSQCKVWIFHVSEFILWDVPIMQHYLTSLLLICIFLKRCPFNVCSRLGTSSNLHRFLCFCRSYSIWVVYWFGSLRDLAAFFRTITKRVVSQVPLIVYFNIDTTVDC